jgi:hypothetical protein
LGYTNKTEHPRPPGLTGGGEVVRIIEGNPERQKKKLRTQIHGKFNDISSADENK